MKHPDSPKAGTSDLSTVPLKRRACVACHSRKVKCNKSIPCRNCLQWSLDCVYPSPIRRCQRPRKSTLSDFASNETATSEVSDESGSLVQRIQKIELLLARLGILSDQETFSNTEKSSPDSSSPKSMKNEKLERIEARLCEHFRLTDQTNKYHMLGNNLSIGSPDSPSLGAFDSKVIQHHLQEPQARVCWHTYQTYLDPVLKVTHRPSAREIFQKALNDSSDLNEDEAALLFAIYFSAMTVLSENDIQLHFGTSKTALVSTYSSIAEIALMRCERSGARGIIWLQALTLFVSINSKMGKANQMWEIEAVKERLDLASMTTKLPFERELQNRLAWHLWYLNVRSAKERDQEFIPPEPLNFTMPLNINDIDLDPLMPLDPIPYPGWTDISFALVRFELAKVSVKLRSSSNIIEKEELIDQCEDHIQSIYLRFCSPTTPLAWLAHHVSYVHLMELRFKLRYANLSALSVPNQRRASGNKLLLASIDILDLPRRLKNEPQSAHWTWLLPAFKQFLPLQFLLKELCIRRPRGQIIDYAWSVAEIGVSRWSHENRNSENYGMLIKLMDRAKEIRLDMLTRQALHVPVLEPIPLASFEEIGIQPDYSALFAFITEYEAVATENGREICNNQPDLECNVDRFGMEAAEFMCNSSIGFRDDIFTSALDNLS
jgi:Fungal Zn(2)-Cys(6) binuclear cluster domain